MHSLQKSQVQYLFLAKTMALNGRTQGDKNQNNAKQSNMYDCILEHFAQLSHQFSKQRKLCCFFPSREFPILLCWKGCARELQLGISDCWLHLPEVNRRYFVNCWTTHLQNRQSLPMKSGAKMVLQVHISITKSGHHSECEKITPARVPLFQ